MADTYVVERSTTIAAPPADVWGRVVDLKEWDHWSPWAAMDPNMSKTYSGEPGAPGSSYRWSGNRKVGEGQMTIKDVDPEQRVAIDLKFLKPFKSESVTEVLVTANGDGTNVTWRMTGAQTFMTKVMGVFGKGMDKMVGPDFEKGLTSLKSLAEAG